MQKYTDETLQLIRKPPEHFKYCIALTLQIQMQETCTPIIPVIHIILHTLVLQKLQFLMLKSQF